LVVIDDMRRIHDHDPADRVNGNTAPIHPPSEPGQVIVG
jgi:hypothetical protein